MLIRLSLLLFTLTLPIILVLAPRKPVSRSLLPSKLYLPGPLSQSPSDPRILGWESEEITPQALIDISNRYRREAGAPVLHADKKLMQAAQLRAQVMLRTQNIDHQDPIEGLNLAAVLPKVNYQFVYASENISLSQSNSEGIMAGFMSSPNHKINLLDKNLIETGVGVVKGTVAGNYVVIVAHLFGVPRDQSAYQGAATTARSSDPAKQAIISRQLDILSQLEKLQDPTLPYTEKSFALLTEYKANLSRL